MDEIGAAEVEQQRDVIHFDAHHLFGEYRAGMESLTTLGAPPPRGGGAGDDAVSDTSWDCEEEEMLRMLAARDAPLEPAESMQVEPAPEAPQPAQHHHKATVHGLFAYLDEAFLRRLMPRYEALHQLIHDRCRPLLAKLAEQARHIHVLWHAFAARLVLEVLAADARGLKIRTTLAELEELYMRAAGHKVRGAKCNWANMDMVRALAHQTTVESLNFAEDKFRIACANPKKRGRRTDEEKKNVPHILNAIKRKHIVSKKSPRPAGGGEQPAPPQPAPAPDFYPLWVKILAIFDACAPRADNHGWYLERLHRAARTLTAREWPLRGLVRSLLNMERVFERRRVTLTRDHDAISGARFLCAYTGEPLAVGDEVWLVRVLVNSAKRQKKWYVKGKVPAEASSAPEFMRSVRAYFVRCEVTSLCSVFYAPYAARDAARPEGAPRPESKPARKSSRPAPPPHGLPPHRQFCVSTLWLLMNRVRVFIGDNALARHVSHRAQRARSMEAEMACLAAMLEQALGGGEFARDWRTFLTVATFGLEYTRELHDRSAADPAFRPDPRLAQYNDTTHDTVMDFIDALLPPRRCAGGGGEGTESSPSAPSPLLQQYDMAQFGIVLAESALERAGGAKKGGVRAVRPALAKRGGALLATQLLAMSAEREEARAARLGTPRSYREERERMARLEDYLTRHPFLFLALFELLFAPHAAPRIAAFPEPIVLLARMHLCISVD